MILILLPFRFGLCRLEASAPVPAWAQAGDFWSVTHTAEELSILCIQGLIPQGTPVEADWRAFQVKGPLDFALIGILADLSGALAKAGISLFAMSTFDTDYLLVKEEKLNAAAEALRAAGHEVRGS